MLTYHLAAFSRRYLTVILERPSLAGVHTVPTEWHFLLIICNLTGALQGPGHEGELA